MTARSSRSSASSETLTSGGGHDTIGSNSDEDNSYSAEYPMNGADGVIDIPTLDRANGFYMTGVDYKNSLHIDDKTGRFHLGSQWQVPSSKAAQSTAGSKFGAASIWTEWTQPRLSSTMRPSPPPGLNTALPDEVMTGRMQNLDLAKMHEPLPGRSDGRMREGSQHYGSGAQYKATPAPLVNYYDYADFETEEDVFFVRPKKVTMAAPLAISRQRTTALWYKRVPSLLISQCGVPAVNLFLISKNASIITVLVYQAD